MKMDWDKKGHPLGDRRIWDKASFGSLRVNP